MRLLFRFYEPSQGSIYVDGQDVRTLDIEDLRSYISVMPQVTPPPTFSNRQDTPLFNNTIYYNIAYGRPSASEAQVVEAAKKAQIHDVISKLPDGYNTMVGERGLMLSGTRSSFPADPQAAKSSALLFLGLSSKTRLLSSLTRPPPPSIP